MVIPPLPWRFDTCKVQPPSPPKPKSQNVKSKKEKEKKAEKNRNKSEKAQIRTFSPHHSERTFSTSKIVLLM